MVLRHLITGLCFGLTVVLLLASTVQMGLVWLIVIGIVAANLGAIGSVILDSMRPKRHGRASGHLSHPAQHPKR